MRKVFLVLASVFALSAANAQDSNTGFHFSGGLRLALPVGDFNKMSGLGIGAELQGENMFSENVSGLISAGYTSFMGKTVTYPAPVGEVKGSSAGFIPVLAGVRFYPSTSFFVGAKAGISLSTQSGGGSAFTYEPQVGLNGNKYQFSLGYNAMTKNSFTSASIGLSALYKFN